MEKKSVCLEVTVAFNINYINVHKTWQFQGLQYIDWKHILYMYG